MDANCLIFVTERKECRLTSSLNINKRSELFFPKSSWWEDGVWGRWCADACVCGRQCVWTVLPSRCHGHGPCVLHWTPRLQRMLWCVLRRKGFTLMFVFI